MKKRSTYRFPFEQFPAVRIALLFGLGIILSNAFDPSVTSALSIYVSVFIFYLISERLSQKRISLSKTRSSTILFLLVILLSGFSLYSVHSNQPVTLTEKIISVSDWEEIEIEGRVISKSKNSTGKLRLDAEVSEVSLASGKIKEKITSRVLWDVNEKIEQGDKIHLKGTIIPISEPRNPSSFNYREFLEKRNIHSQIRADSIFSISTSNTFFDWITIRKKALRLVDKNFNETTSPIAKALLLGYKNELEGATRQAFARAGLSHIMAVSGLHVGLVIAPFWLIIPFFWTRKHGTKVGLALLILILFFYAGLTGFSAPVLRASVMAILLTYGKLFSKSADSINLMGIAALVILFFDPKQLFEVGFQLSFSAVLIILLVLPVIQSKIPYWVRIKWYGTPVMVIIISLVVQFGLYPLQAYYFGEVSVISPIANALFVPFLGIIVPLSLFALLVSAFIPLIGFLINYPSFIFLQILNDFVSFSSSLSWAWVKVQKPSVLVFLFWSLFVLTIASWRNPSIKWKLMICSLSALLLIQGNQIIKFFQYENLRVIVFDVGQGDASLIQTPSGKNFLIDTGTWSPGSNSGKQILLPFFKENNIAKLDAVFLSHPHADHIGGIIDLINHIEIDTIYNSGYTYDSKLYQNYLQLAESKQIPVISLRSGININIDPDLLILTLGPEGSVFNNDPNQHSLILNIIYGESEFLFTGDAGEDQEKRVVENYSGLLDTDFLKVGHHGSRTSSELFFLEKVTPEIAVISVADKNRFKHPHPEAMKRLVATNSKIYFTSRDKALIFESDGEKIQRVIWDRN